MGKVAGVVGTFALATAGAPTAAVAAKKAVEVVETVDNTKKLIAGGAAVIAAGAVGMKALGEKQQNFLEAKPYWDQATVPVNVYKNKAPFTGKVVSTAYSEWQCLNCGGAELYIRSSFNCGGARLYMPLSHLVDPV